MSASASVGNIRGREWRWQRKILRWAGLETPSCAKSLRRGGMGWGGGGRTVFVAEAADVGRGIGGVGNRVLLKNDRSGMDW